MSCEFALGFFARGAIFAQLGLSPSSLGAGRERGRSGVNPRDADEVGSPGSPTGGSDSLRPAMRVLMIGGEPEEGEQVQQTLADSSSLAFELTHVERLTQAMEMLDSLRIDAVLLVVEKASTDGRPDQLDQLAQLCIRAPKLPVLILSHVDDEALAVQALQTGARGFLLMSEAGTRLLTTTLCAAQGTHRTILELSQAHEQARHTATHDLLTGLPNRQLFNDHNFPMSTPYRDIRRSHALAALRSSKRPERRPQHFCHRELWLYI